MGNWLHGVGAPNLGGKPTFAVLNHAHQTFHLEAGKVARTINQVMGRKQNGCCEAAPPLPMAPFIPSKVVRRLTDYEPVHSHNDVTHRPQLAVLPLG